MSRWKTNSESTLCLMTKSVVGWLPVLESAEACDIIIEAMTHSMNHKGTRLHGYVIMPNHFHAIPSASTGQTISNMMRDFGTYTSKRLTEYLDRQDSASMLRVFRAAAWMDQRGNDFKVWQEGFHPIAFRSERFFREKLNSMHYNPVRKLLVERPEQWKYSSARNYILGDHSVIPVVCL